MVFSLRSPLKSLDSRYKKESLSEAPFTAFTRQLATLADGVKTATAQNQSEEHFKNLLADFLKATFYADFQVNTKSYKGLHEADLVISKKGKDEPVQVLFEVKRPGSSEMILPANPQKKALFEAITYYLWEREVFDNRELKHVVICDLENWFIFDGQEFYQRFGKEKKIVRFFNQWREKKTDSDSTSQMYDFLSRYLAENDFELACTHYSLQEFTSQLGKDTEAARKRLTELYKLLSPAHLLKDRKVADSNELNKEFYHELLYILGLEEVKDKGKKVIGRASNPQRGTLIESARSKIKSEGLIDRVQKSSVYGNTTEDQLQGIALELAITWTNRVLFLKLLEAQLLSYHDGDPRYAFLSPQRIRSYDDLNSLFFEVLAIRQDEREPWIKESLGHIPYLNSSLFEPTDLEKDTLRISGLRETPVPIYAKTVLLNAIGKRRSGEELDTLSYLLQFLNAYDFGAETKNGFKETGKTLINASVLGLIFEKINGYKDGSFFTPGFITMYMARETLQKAVLDKFNQKYGWSCQDLSEVYNKVDRVDIREANDLINSITICDPAVGSGHFLVSCLNELLAIKSRLGILMDNEGKRLRDWVVLVDNDELAIENEETGEPFTYTPPTAGANRRTESQRVQQTLFDEKRKLIESSLFGVDINPNSVKICRLRLWIELLKHTYYSPESSYNHLETLPNLDINIKVGNSLLSRFSLADDLGDVFRNQKFGLTSYLVAVQTYRQTEDIKAKQDLRKLIQTIKDQYSTTILNNDRRKKDLRSWRGKWEELETLTKFGNLLGEKLDPVKTEKEIQSLKKKYNDLQEVLNKEAESGGSGMYADAFEWRYEFPEVLADNGAFKGFDVVIANPPYIRQEELKDLKSHLQSRYKTYAGTADLYVYFVELGMDLLAPQGHFCYIFPNKWMRAGYGAALREWLGQYQMEGLIDFGDLPVFEEATTYPIILNLKKAPGDRYFPAAQVKTLDFEGQELEQFVVDKWTRVDREMLKKSGWSLGSEVVGKLMQKLKSKGVPLGEYVNGKVYYGIKTGLNEAFVIDEAVKNRLIAEDPHSAEIIKPFLAGRDVKRWQVDFRNTYLLFTRRGIDIDGYPAIKQHLSQFREQLEPKPKGWTNKWKGRKEGTYRWYEVQDSIDYYLEFEKPKIMYQEIATYSQFTIDRNQYYSNNKTFIIPEGTDFLLGVLNSKLTWFFLNQVASKLQGGALAMQTPAVFACPVVQDTRFAKEIEERVLGILESVDAGDERRTQELESQIDELVFELYGLSQEEVGIVLGEINQRNEL